MRLAARSLREDDGAHAALQMLLVARREVDVNEITNH